LCEGGIAVLIDEAIFHYDDFDESISAIESFHSRVMWALLASLQYLLEVRRL